MNKIQKSTIPKFKVNPQSIGKINHVYFWPKASINTNPIMQTYPINHWEFLEENSRISNNLNESEIGCYIQCVLLYLNSKIFVLVKICDVTLGKKSQCIIKTVVKSGSLVCIPTKSLFGIFLMTGLCQASKNFPLNPLYIPPNKIFLISNIVA